LAESLAAKSLAETARLVALLRSRALDDCEDRERIFCPSESVLEFATLSKIFGNKTKEEEIGNVKGKRKRERCVRIKRRRKRQREGGEERRSEGEGGRWESRQDRGGRETQRGGKKIKFIDNKQNQGGKQERESNKEMEDGRWKTLKQTFSVRPAVLRVSARSLW